MNVNSTTSTPASASVKTNDNFITSYFKNEFRRIGKLAAYHISLAYTVANQRAHPNTMQWWNPIKGTNIVLGAIPLYNLNHHKKISDLAKSRMSNLSVLTFLEPFEYNTVSLFSIPVTPKQWEKLGIEQKIIPASDFHRLKPAHTSEAVSFLEEQEALGNTIYTHCKAGRGRSAAGVVCYVMKKFQISAEEALERVREGRPQINLNSHQWQSVKDFEASLKGYESRKSGEHTFSQHS